MSVEPLCLARLSRVAGRFSLLDSFNALRSVRLIGLRDYQTPHANIEVHSVWQSSSVTRGSLVLCEFLPFTPFPHLKSTRSSVAGQTDMKDCK